VSSSGDAEIEFLRKGSVMAGYRIERILGAGGMGVVYQATQLSLNRTVALKVLSPGLSRDPTFRKRFRREAEIQAGLDHPHIVAVHEAGETAAGLFMAMRLIRGPNLKDMIVGRELDPGRSIRILASVAEALDAAHAAGLVHRDVKPHNILLAGSHPFLADFGLTQAADASHLTATGQFVGTFDYIAPEQIEGKQVTAQADIYSLTAVLYECMTGQVPFPARSQAALIYAHLELARPRPTNQRPELPSALNDVVARGMAKDPTARPATAARLIEEAERAFDNRTRAVLRPPPPVERAEELGVREPEGQVSTQEAARRDRPAPGGPSAAAPAPVPAPKPSAPAERDATHVMPRRPARAFVGASLAVVAVAAVAGALIGSAGGSPSPKADSLGARASVGSVDLAYPTSWRREDTNPAVPGLRFNDPVRIAASNDGATGVVAGQVATTGPTLLAQSFLARLPDRTPTGTAVRLGGHAAYRYPGLRPRGLGGSMTAYTVPTSKGVATIACITGPQPAPSFASRCDAVASSLVLHGVTIYPIGANPRYSRALSSALGTLNAQRGAVGSRLTAAKTPAAQATAAGTLALAYGAARKRLAAVSPGPVASDVHARLLTALASASAGYGALAAAARRHSKAGYAKARGAIVAADRSLKTQLTALRTRGF
jgi:serine/threonine-protein kinase